ncbi:T9SS type A sorting domain-containing protein [Flavobacterium jejuense]|uniref:T9SS type A sorting domain-containing protein n=1 Tax=Flavobacterium jejuense TaxID=1544455 RepID=A0ABX0IVY7_9FLAO|nr:zinc-dependent metalloprotease family protein [Flavobacterium jejuense]NHN27355.1 T9SS type A sorting domain-containing protein [Flavobacterium jejuense]
MKKLLLKTFLLLLFCNGYAQNKLWEHIPNKRLNTLKKMERASMPLEYQLFSLDLQLLKTKLIEAPNDLSEQSSNIIIAFPNDKGEMLNFKVYDSPVMEEGLAVKFPDIKTYLAKGIDDPTATMRFSITQFGLHAMILSGTTGTTYIDTYTEDLKNYIVYNRVNLLRTKGFECSFDELDHEVFKPLINEGNALSRASDGNFRIYRLAMACTGEYAAFHGGTVAAAQAAIVVTVNRVNSIYERDFSARLSLVANNNLLIYTNGSTDPYTNDSGGAMLGENQTNVTAIIGSANYDIGHVVSTNGGGVAGLGVVCNSSQKGRGVTGTNSPVGDPFDIDYVAHEVGHQFGCNHTFNNSCGGNRNSSTAVEPGSGSTIMAYAGICAPNVQNNSDAHFSFISIAEANTRTLLGTSCANVTANGNSAPLVNAGPDYVIPRGTAFILKGGATDVNGDALTYCWEQTDSEISTQSPLQTSTSGPNFRSRLPVASPDRYMPRIQDVINNNLAPTWEVVPNVARTMNFALTVRDNRAPNGGQTGIDNTVITTSTAGPFLVNSPNTAVSWVAGTNQTVTWTVAGTDSNGINASYVDILLSTDGGFTYPILLASKVPNDGSEIVTAPNNLGSQNRIMVRGYNHIFYDISNTNFSITAAPSSFSVAFSGVEGTQNTAFCSGGTVDFTINYTALGGFSSSTSFTATGNPSGSTVSFNPNPISTTGTVTLTLGNLASVAGGDYQILVNATSGAVTKTVPFYLSIGISPVILTVPVNNATAQNTSLNLTWNPNPNATSYDVQVATDNTFTNIASSGNVTSSSYSVSGLSQGTDYFWRVLPKNATCTGVYGSAYKFTTGTISCASTSSTNVPVAISASGTPTITSSLTIPSGGSIADVNVTMNITHSWINDLTATLTSPSGTIVQLFSNECNPNASINNIVATFDDSGTALVCGNNPGISGTVLPEQVLSVFNGENSTGAWVLTVSDAFNQDGGALNSWSLNICTVQPLANGEFDFEDFALYPNPNKGSFTVKFSSKSINDIEVNIYDISGREVYKKSYSNTGNFNQNIKLDSVQSGVYLVAIIDGSKKTMAKIVIE